MILHGYDAAGISGVCQAPCAQIAHFQGYRLCLFHRRICALGQLIQNGFLSLGLAKADAGTATSICLIFLSALLTGLNLYNSIARFAGAGTLVPITGFANSVVSPAIDFKSEGFITGMASKMFVVAGPVIVFGTLASVVYGVILMLMG